MTHGAPAVEHAAARSSRIATVVVHQWVRPDAVDAYLRWQEGFTAAARSAPGFLGKEVFEPKALADGASDADDDGWVVVFRFASSALLEAWLLSESRRLWITRGAGLMTRPDRLLVLSGDSLGGAAAVAVASHRVRAGREPEFRAWQARMMAAEAGFPGSQGSLLYPPVAGLQPEWVTLLRFDAPSDLERWLGSDVRTRLLREGEPLVETVTVDRLSGGFGRWFAPSALAGGSALLAPLWKQTLAVLLGLYPLVYLIGRVPLGHVVRFRPPGLLLIGNLLSCFILAYFVMPLVNRGLAFWLRPSRDESLAVNAAGTLLVAAFLGLLLSLFTELSS